ncbi:MAG TPA: aldo/keto reductase [Acidobacteriaceae bacterium]
MSQIRISIQSAKFSFPMASRFLLNFARRVEDRVGVLVNALGAIAADKGITLTQLAIASVLSRGENIVPIPGARTRKQLKETLGALKVRLSAEDLARIDQVFGEYKIAGERYPEPQMRVLDSEH